MLCFVVLLFVGLCLWCLVVCVAFVWVFVNPLFCLFTVVCCLATVAAFSLLFG